MKKCYTIALLCLISALTATAQTARYWVGPATGSEGVWNNTAYWSASPGGPGGASVPNGNTFDAIFSQNATVNVNLASITLNSIKVTNNATAALYSAIDRTITLTSSSVANPALDIDAGSTLRDSVNAEVVSTILFAANAKGEIDGDFRLGSEAALYADVHFETNAAGVVVNVNSTGRVIFGPNGGAVGTPATLNFNAGSQLIVDRDFGFTPTANYNTNSTIKIIGNITTGTTLSGFPAVVGNVEYNSPLNVTNPASLGLTNGTIIKGNLRILGTNGEKLVLTSNQNVPSGINVTVQGNLEISGNTDVVIGNGTQSNLNFRVDGNFIQSGGAVSLKDNNANFATNLIVKGDFTQTAGTFTSNSTLTNASTNFSTVELNGTSNQNISVSSGTIDNANNQVALRLNNPAGATLLTPLAVGRMNFTSGNLTTTSTNLLTINNTSTDAFVINGVNDNSFVNGPVRRRTNAAAAYIFPTGKAGDYRLIEVIPSTTAASDYTAEYFATAHPDGDVVLPLTGRSNDEYWTVQRGSGSNAAIRLTLEGAVSNSNSGMEIVVGRYNGAAWESVRGSTGTSINGDATTGTVTSQVVGAFGPFTFVFGPAGTLPIKLTEFTATKAGAANSIHWKAECTSTQAVFEIERSSDGQNFQKIETVVADQQRCLMPFNFEDKAFSAGTNYYRIRVVDVDGRSFYSRIVAIVNRSKGFELVGIYPTLVTGSQLKINVTAANRDKAELYVTNLNGQVLKRMQVSVNAGENIIYMNVESLAAGVYHITGKNSEGETRTMRFVKQ